MDIRRIKSDAKVTFQASYWKSVAVAFIMGLLATSTKVLVTVNKGGGKGKGKLHGSINLSLTPEEWGFLAMIASLLVGLSLMAMITILLLRIFLFNPLQQGCYDFFKKNMQEKDTSVGVIMNGFKGYGRTFLTLFLRDLFLALWTCLFVVPGFIKAYSYRLVPYLLNDEPELSGTEVITRSRELMNGHKMEAFLLDFSFIGWILLSIITADLVGIFWTNPYMENARAGFYLELIRNEGRRQA